MFKQYIKQVIDDFHSQKMLCGVQIFGTALAIFMVMFYVMMRDVSVNSISPETHRDRYLHICEIRMSPTDTTQKWENKSGISTFLYKRCFKNLKVPETVACYSSFPMVYSVGLSEGKPQPFQVKYCDDQYWKAIDFQFIEGRPFNEVESESSYRIAVITDRVAKSIFGTLDVCGKNISLNEDEYKVVGVVKEVSSLANVAYSQIWIPYTLLEENDSPLGMFGVLLVARTRDDFEAIHQECEKARLKFNEGWSDKYMVKFGNMPYDQEKNMYLEVGFNSQEPDVPYQNKIRFLVILALLLVPAINLNSMAQSRFRKRMAEIGVRRAFGATRYFILGQVFVENLILTLIAGTVGLVLCILLSYFGSDFIYKTYLMSFMSNGTAIHIDFGALMRISTFLWAFFFCFVLNLMSSLYPAWVASRANIVDALKGN